MRKRPNTKFAFSLDPEGFSLKSRSSSGELFKISEVYLMLSGNHEIPNKDSIIEPFCLKLFLLNMSNYDTMEDYDHSELGNLTELSNYFESFNAHKMTFKKVFDREINAYSIGHFVDFDFLIFLIGVFNNLKIDQTLEKSDYPIAASTEKRPTITKNTKRKSRKVELVIFIFYMFLKEYLHKSKEIMDSQLDNLFLTILLFIEFDDSELDEICKVFYSGNCTLKNINFELLYQGIFDPNDITDPFQRGNLEEFINRKDAHGKKTLKTLFPVKFYKEFYEKLKNIYKYLIQKPKTKNIESINKIYELFKLIEAGNIKINTSKRGYKKI
ncbi:MAG: hypothetical protein ACYDDB_03560 [bacterium]